MAHYSERGHWVDVLFGWIEPDGRVEWDDRVGWRSRMSFGTAMDEAERAMDEYAANRDAVVVAVYSPAGHELVAWLRDGDDWRRA